MEQESKFAEPDEKVFQLPITAVANLIDPVEREREGGGKCHIIITNMVKLLHTVLSSR